MQILLEAFIKPRPMVLDAYVFIGDCSYCLQPCSHHTSMLVFVMNTNNYSTDAYFVGVFNKSESTINTTLLHMKDIRPYLMWSLLPYAIIIPSPICKFPM
jgi:hypothetical protein